MITPGKIIPTDARDPVRALAELPESGLLWLINAVVFHPRGVALALRRTATGEIVGWQLLGDGSDPWQFVPGPEIDSLFLAANKTIFDHCEREHARRPAVD